MMLLIVTAWLACGIVAAGTIHADCLSLRHNDAERRQSRRVALGVGSLFGPVALLAALAITGFAACGWTLSIKER